MPVEPSPPQLADPCSEGDAHFFVGPARLPNGRARGGNDRVDDCLLHKLAVIAADYGETTLADSQGSVVTFRRDW